MVPAKCGPRAELPVEAYLPGAPIHLVTTEFLRYSQGDFLSAHYELGSLFQAAKIQPQIPIKYLPNKTEFRYKLALSKLTLRTHPERLQMLHVPTKGCFPSKTCKTFMGQQLYMVIQIKMTSKKVNHFKFR